LARNQHRVAAHGREPGLRLERRGSEVPLTRWAGEVLEECAPIAAALDGVHGSGEYAVALAAAVAALREPDTVPSAHVLDAMAKDFDHSYVRFVRAQSEHTRNALLRLPFSAELQARFTRLAQESIEEQKRIEAADTLPFETFREQYLSTERLGLPSSTRNAA
jgi:glutamate--cysteine ligase